MGRLLRIVGLLVATVLLLLFFGSFFIDSAIKSGINSVGPGLVKTDLHLESVSTSILRGRVSLGGLTLGNPQGFQQPNALTVRRISGEGNLFSLLSETIEVDELEIDGLDLFIEQRLDGQNNLQQLAKAMRSSPKKEEPAKETVADDQLSPPTQKRTQKHIIVRRLIIQNCRVSAEVIGAEGLASTLAIPDMVLHDVGTQEGGIPVAQLTAIILDELVKAYQRAQVEQQGERLLKDRLEDVEKEVKKGFRKLLDRF